jgi:hypothetical protein
MESTLFYSKVPRSLEIKNKLFGLELPDLLIIFLNLSFSNFLFGASSYRYPLVWGSSILLALFLYFFKKGRPDDYIKHFFGFYFGATVFEVMPKINFSAKDGGRVC